MKTGEIIHAVEKKKSEILRKAADGARQKEADPADRRRPIEWHDLLCRLGREGSPNARRLGRYLTKNAGRIVGGLQLVSERDTDAKVNKYRVRQCRDYGVTRSLTGIPVSSSRTQHVNSDIHGNSCIEKDAYLKVMSKTG